MGVSPGGSGEILHVSAVGRHMATNFELVISTSCERRVAALQVLEQAHAAITDLERTLSEYLPTSPVHQLNRGPALVPVAAPEPLITLLDRAEHLRCMTAGAFDCGAKGIATTHPRFGWDRERGLVWKEQVDAHLGFGAIGKGFALEVVRGIVEREGFTDYYLSGGGSSLVLSGYSAPQTPWTWGWGWGQRIDGEVAGIALTHTSGRAIAIGISGTEHQGPHLIDPRTGEPVTPVTSALVAHPRAAEADALSTALFVGGWDRNTPWIGANTEEIAMALIDHQGMARWNGWFQSLWGTLASFIVMVLAAAPTRADEAVDLSTSPNDFLPFVTERHWAWILLPAAALFLVALHLKKNRNPNQNKD